VAADFTTRILAHVLDEVAQRSGLTLTELPWVLGGDTTLHDALAPNSTRWGVLTPTRGQGLVDGGEATVAMTLIEGLAWLVDHEVVLVAFARDAAPPYNEALAAALLLARSRRAGDRLRLVAPQLRRSGGHSAPGTLRCSPLSTSVEIARAACVGQPTIQTEPFSNAERPEHWRIELRSAF